MDNTPDYKENLAFAPTSADDLNTKGRDSDVLIKALDKCERLQKQLDIAVECLKFIATHTCCYDEDIKSQLSMVYAWSCESLEEIEEQDNEI